MTIESTIKQPPITFCFDDEKVIKRMKEIGIWEQVQEARKAKTTVFIMCNDELFIWHDCPTDSGYSLTKSNSRAALMLAIAMVAGNTETTSKQTRH